MPDYTIGLLEGAFGDLKGAKVVVLGASYRGGVKETAFSGVFPAVEALKARGAEVSVHDPMYTDEELQGLGFTPYTLGAPVDAAVLQADHAEYAQLGPADLPGVKVLVDGRDRTDAAKWAGVRRIVIGRSVSQ
jgi:UDP-N-acetyl-D-mannosaminuronate dehydrogenase